MGYNFKADKHAHTNAIALVNGFSSANLTDITTCVALAFYSYCQNSPKAFYSCSRGISFVLHCIIVAFYILTPLGAISKDN